MIASDIPLKSIENLSERARPPLAAHASVALNMYANYAQRYQHGHCQQLPTTPQRQFRAVLELAARPLTAIPPLFQHVTTPMPFTSTYRHWPAKRISIAVHQKSCVRPQPLEKRSIALLSQMTVTGWERPTVSGGSRPGAVFRLLKRPSFKRRLFTRKRSFYPRRRMLHIALANISTDFIAVASGPLHAIFGCYPIFGILTLSWHDADVRLNDRVNRCRMLAQQRPMPLGDSPSFHLCNDM
ncbi:protein of unknown function [Burkholderia multivorans]